MEFSRLDPLEASGAEVLSGRITVQSRRGAGSEFALASGGDFVTPSR
jgi:hypothetical protein